MKRRYLFLPFIVVTIMLILSMLLSACNGTQSPDASYETAVTTEAETDSESASASDEITTAETTEAIAETTAETTETVTTDVEETTADVEETTTDVEETTTDVEETTTDVEETTTEAEETTTDVEETTTEPLASDRLTDEGLTFSVDERVYMTENLGAFPVTLQFKIILDENVPIGTWHGVLLSNSIRWGEHIAIQINEKRNPGFNFGGLSTDSVTGKIKNSPKAYMFNEVELPVGEEIDLVIVIDRTENKAHCYVNGELLETISINKKYIVDRAYTENPFVIGGNTTGSNYLHFRGEMLSMALWSNARTADEIAMGGAGSPELRDPNLIVRYEFCREQQSDKLLDASGNGYDLSVDRLWMNTDEVEAATGDYCFAVLGDTQSLSYMHPNSMSALYDWLVNNQAKHNIQYVLGLGDITEKSEKWEWELFKNNIAKLDGKMPYLMAMGNHDKYDFKEAEIPYVPVNRDDFLFNQYLCNENYLQNIAGHYTEEGEKDVTCAYNAIQLGNTKWLILTLDFGPTDAMLDWASGVIESYPDHKVIITTHSYLYRDGSLLDEDDCYAPSGYNSEFNDADGMFEKLIKKHENIVLVLSGHDPHDHIVYTQVKGENGNTVTQMLIDPQYMDSFYGPTGMVALLYYTEKTNSLTVRYYSTVKGLYGSELSQFTVDLD